MVELPHIDLLSHDSADRFFGGLLARITSGKMFVSRRSLTLRRFCTARFGAAVPRTYSDP
ncbi:MAG: hypothetical protein HW416_1938 [Chloroflexi bacterium]|nr:hypothetical protein [Chloroflexota bacterium]